MSTVLPVRGESSHVRSQPNLGQSRAFTRRALDLRAGPVDGRSVGDCYDTAVIESFWARMQVELLDRQRWRTRVELANAIFEYLEIFHNRKCGHSDA
jgi:putative transposase